ncbi:hypothetical protein A2851_00920 [Candidatus Kaiserbacteria bacterium RIFCSPHIGHO2_01_FULL_53_29]|nr:MAG: hypothetical protein A2851_00920 [Candidatus Kaiserbacteria bacterium RIFCSPHIGHO2_01_FULL_53_29]
MRFPTHREFERQAKKLSLGVQDKLWKRIELLITDERNPLLNDHKLHHPFDGYSSINITGDWRLVYKKLDAQTFYLRAVGTHHQLFGS